MSVSLLEVIEAGGYNLATLEDANWLLSKENEFEELIEKAQELVDEAEAKEDAEAEAKYRKTFPSVIAPDEFNSNGIYGNDNDWKD